MDILIAGAGIAGLAAAVALGRSGHRVTVQERATSLEEVGAGIQLSPNGMKALAALGLSQEVSAIAVEPLSILVRKARDGMLVSRLPLSGAKARWGAAYCVAHRADLQHVLRQAAETTPGVNLVLGSSFSTYEDGKGCVRLADGSTGAVLVGADGVWSSVRSAMGLKTPLVFAKRRAYRALVPRSEVADFTDALSTTLWLGPDAHLVAYPVDGGRTLNLVAVVADDNATPGWSSETDTLRLLHLFRHWNADARNLIRKAGAFRSWPLFDRRPDPFWMKGRAVLIGDAAHPMLPFVAQGGAQALEDAVVLASALGGPGTVEERLTRFVSTRYARVAAIQREARANSARYHLGFPASSARDAAMKLMGADRLIGRYDWIYGWKP